ncbi:hypothetical protein ONZ45_g17051 [Pleurotus djamor]|nr:hypothetical protein ONZ45_g17051 [Pleurotus djamor]
MNEEEPSFRSIYLNLDFPVPTREWDGVFDAWVQGDAQTFTEMLLAEIKREAEIKEQALERKKKREEDAAMAQSQATGLQTPNPSPQSNKRKNSIDGTASNSNKKRRISTSNDLPLLGTSDSPLFNKSKILLRIPPRLKWIPEVVISSKPHTISKRAPAVQSPLTPPRTPPRKIAKPSRTSKRHRPKGNESDTPNTSSSSSSSPSHPLISLSTRLPSTSVQSILAAG